MLRKSFFLLLLLAGISHYAQAEAWFADLQHLPPSEKYIAALRIYDTRIAHLDSAAGIAALQQLQQLATEQDDDRLTAAFLALMGDYYKEMYKGPQAITYLKQALVLADKYQMKHMQADVYANLGWIYYTMEQNYPLAFENMLKANNLIQDEIGYDHYLQSNKFLYSLAYMYYNFNNLERAKCLLLKALQYPFSSSLYQIRVYNTLGLTYRETNHMDSAAWCFKKVIDIANATHKLDWLGIATGNLGVVYHKQGNDELAIPLLKKDYELSIATYQWESAGNALWNLINIRVKKNDLAGCEQQLAEVLDYYHKSLSIYTLYGYYLTRSRLRQAQAKYTEALLYLDSAKILQGELAERNNLIILSQAEQKVELEKHLADIRLLESEAAQKILVRNFVIISIILLLVIAIQFGYRLQHNRKQDAQMLDNARQQLSHYLESLKEKNALIEHFQEEIEHLNTLPEYLLQKEKEDLTDKLKKYTILTDTHWNEFRHLFDKVHKNFFEKLKLQYPHLTPAETRLLALLKLNLSKREIAEMLGVSADTVKKTRQRIQHKIALPEDLYLEDIVLKL